LFKGDDNMSGNVGAGALFKNDRKEKPSQPDYRGDITILGEKYRLAGWVKETKKGGKYLSIVARPDLGVDAK
jgi:uncharacterized protein (DUF736 family)